jgi:hypothetical protein
MNLSLKIPFQLQSSQKRCILNLKNLLYLDENLKTTVCFDQEAHVSKQVLCYEHMEVKEHFIEKMAEVVSPLS